MKRMKYAHTAPYAKMYTEAYTGMPMRSLARLSQAPIYAI